MGTSEFQRSPRSEKKEVERSKISSAQLHHADIVEAFLGHLGKSRELPGSSQEAQFSVKLIRSAMKLEAAERGRVIFSLIVLPQLTNLYNTLHGGAIGVIAEQVAQACVMTVSNDEFFLGSPMSLAFQLRRSTEVKKFLEDKLPESTMFDYEAFKFRDLP